MSDRFLKGTQTEPGTDGSTVFDLGTTAGSSLGVPVDFGTPKRWQMVVTAPAADSIPTSVDVQVGSGGEGRWRLLRLDSDGSTVLARSAWATNVTTSGIHTETLTLETPWQVGDLIAIEVENLADGVLFQVLAGDVDSHIDVTDETVPTAPEILVEVYDRSTTPVLMGSETFTDLSLVEAGVQKIIATSDIDAPQTVDIHLTNTGRTVTVSRLLGSEDSAFAHTATVADAGPAQTDSVGGSHDSPKASAPTDLTATAVAGPANDIEWVNADPTLQTRIYRRRIS